MAISGFIMMYHAAQLAFAERNYLAAGDAEPPKGLLVIELRHELAKRGVDVGERTARRLDLEALGDRSIATVSCRSAHAFAAVQEWSFELVALPLVHASPAIQTVFNFGRRRFRCAPPHSVTRRFKGRRSPS